MKAKETKVTMTVAIPMRDGRVLLGCKKRGFGMGRWNGFGGKVEPDETLPEAAERELFEESGLRAVSMRKAGSLLVENENDPVIVEFHVFIVDRFEGEPSESDEMKPGWFDSEHLPYERMWPDDKYWYPFLLSGKSFHGHFFLRDNSRVLRYTIDEV